MSEPTEPRTSPPSPHEDTAAAGRSTTCPGWPAGRVGLRGTRPNGRFAATRRPGLGLIRVAARPETRTRARDSVRHALRDAARELTGEVASAGTSAHADGDDDADAGVGQLCAQRGASVLRRSRDVHYEEDGPPRLRAHARRARARRGPDPAAAAARGAAALGRRPHRRAARASHSRLIAQGFTMIGARAGLPLSVARAAVPQQPHPPGPRVVLARDAPRPRPLPGARGPARGARGDEVRPDGEDRPPLHPPDAVRRGLLPDLPGARPGANWTSYRSTPTPRT